MISLDVNIKELKKTYPVIIEWDEIRLTRQKINNYLNGGKFLVVISQKIDKLYGKELGFTKEEKFVLKDGEHEKNFENYRKILNFAQKLKLTRKDAIVAIGGGVVGDIAGFAASTYMRGIDFINIPTTLLACVDSSVGGKTAIDTSLGKNIIGSFYQPKAVLINTNFLKSLNDRDFKTGLGEVIKYAFIEKNCKAEEDFNLSNFLSSNIQKIFEKDNLTMSNLIQICVKLKISVVEKDEKEAGLRKILNFGHTYGHAIEKITRYKKYTHGEAVIEGIKFAFKLAMKKNIIDKNYKFFADDFIKNFRFNEISAFNMKKMSEIMLTDKKSNGKTITFILPINYFSVEEFEISPEYLLSVTE